MAQIGFIGLGKMGSKMVQRLLTHGHRVVVYNRTQDKVRQMATYGAFPASSVAELIEKLPKRKIVWLMLPAGRVTEIYLRQLQGLLQPGDIIIDGANDFYGNAERHAAWLHKSGIAFFDCGVSGGIWGLRNGFTLMLGGPKKSFPAIEPFCKSLAPKGGYALFGEAGAGHFVKSVHNMVEYVYLQGLAEGMETLRRFKQPIDLEQATAVWQPASVIRSWLLELTDTALRRPDFKKISSKIDSVTIEELRKTAKAVKTFAPAFDIACAVRRSSSQRFVFGKRVIAAVRREFGGHSVRKVKR